MNVAERMEPDRQATGADKLRAVAQQMQLEMELGCGRVIISCPYCGGTAVQGETFCCALLLKAVEAIMDAAALNYNIEICERALERHLHN